MTTYTKLRDGSWGVRADGTVKPGQSLTVEKRDGSRQTETVEKVLWSGRDLGTGKFVTICSIAKRQSTREASSPVSKSYARPSAPRRNWKPCGYPGCNPNYCDECDGKGGRGEY